MTRDEALEQLQLLARSDDWTDAAEVLLDFINDAEIRAAYAAVLWEPTWIRSARQPPAPGAPPDA